MKRVAVTGMGIISPVGNSVPAFWDSLLAGKCGIGPLTAFNTEGHKCKVAAEVKDFNDDFLEPGEKRRMDLFSRYALAAALQACQQAGIEKGTINPQRLGVYFSSGIGGLLTLTAEQDRLSAGGPRRVSPLLVPMMISNMAAGHIAIRYHAQGPSLPVVTACATGSNSLGEAFRAIRYGYADAIIAGGSEAPMLPLAVAGFANCMALSQSADPQAASLPFDKRRSGFVMGEGAAAMVLEEYEHAVNRGAPILAELSGYGNTCDAFHITAPEPTGQGATQAMRLALQEAGLQPADIGYINAHGTGTPLNDKVETMAVKQAFGPHAHKLAMSSTKGSTGHMLGAAGAAEAIASVLALNNSLLPPTINYLEPDPDCDLDIVPNKVRKAELKAVMTNSLGFGGHNASLVFVNAE